ncbi:hypothetical protein [Massilia sp. TN1-12]|uniref:hypothetical protein n=1 Tax=Massilia paldalensis TaxID=3377675 RepID=UPI00384DEA2B
MKILRHLVAAAVLLNGAAVHAAMPSATASSTHASSDLPAPAQLAPLAFPGWSAAGPGRVQTVQIPFGTAEHEGWHTGQVRVVVEPKLVLRIDAGHLVLIAGLVPAGGDGRASAAQATPMALAAYQFEKQGSTWHASLSQGIFAWRGFGGNATLHAVALGGQRQGLGVEYGSCWDGYCGTWLALYEPDKGGMRREPAVELALSGTNTAGAADCPRRLQLSGRAQPIAAQVKGGADADAHDCYAIDGSWAVDAAHEQPGDLVIHYHGAIQRGESPLSAPLAVDQRQVLRYASGKYRAVSGFNPVPSL